MIAVFLLSHLLQVLVCDFWMHLHNTWPEGVLETIYAHFCLSNTRIHFVKPFPVPSTCSFLPLHHHDHWNKPPHPITETDCKASRKGTVWPYLL
jgi:hypothetical protein